MTPEIVNMLEILGLILFGWSLILFAFRPGHSKSHNTLSLENLIQENASLDKSIKELSNKVLAMSIERDGLLEHIDACSNQTRAMSGANWISVDDQLPNLLQQVLIFYGGVFYAVIYYGEKECWGVCCAHKFHPNVVHYWMALPEKPEKDDIQYL